MNIDHLVLLCLITKHTICLQRTNSTKRSVIYGKQIWCSMRGHEKHKKHIYIYIGIHALCFVNTNQHTYIYIVIYNQYLCLWHTLDILHIPTISNNSRYITTMRWTYCETVSFQLLRESRCQYSNVTSKMRTSTSTVSTIERTCFIYSSIFFGHWGHCGTSKIFQYIQNWTWQPNRPNI